jgi:hypothetical protein
MSSVYYSLLTDLATQVKTIVPNTLVQRKLQLLETTPLPVCLVAPKLPGGEKVKEKQFKSGPVGQPLGAGIWWLYPIYITYIQAGNPDLTQGLDSFLQYREDIRNLLNQPILSPVPATAGVDVGDQYQVQQFNVTIDPIDALYFVNYLGHNHDVATWQLDVLVSERQIS